MPDPGADSWPRWRPRIRSRPASARARRRVCATWRCASGGPPKPVHPILPHSLAMVASATSGRASGVGSSGIRRWCHTPTRSRRRAPADVACPRSASMAPRVQQSFGHPAQRVEVLVGVLQTRVHGVHREMGRPGFAPAPGVLVHRVEVARGVLETPLEAESRHVPPCLRCSLVDDLERLLQATTRPGLGEPAVGEPAHPAQRSRRRRRRSRSGWAAAPAAGPGPPPRSGGTDPSTVTLRSVHRARSTATCSSRIAPRRSNETPSAAYSTLFHPIPRPKRNRPPHSRSTSAACLASNAVCRWGLIRIEVAKASVVHPAR